MSRYISLYVPAGAAVLEVDPGSRAQPLGTSLLSLPGHTVATVDALHLAGKREPDVIVLNGNVHYERDICRLFEVLGKGCRDHTRLIVVFYSSLWRPFITLATRLGLRKKLPEANWVAPVDVENFLVLGGFEKITHERKILMPVPVPLVAWFLNRIVAPLPLFHSLCLTNIIVARRRPLHQPPASRPSVSVIVPARNEAGNIDAVIERTPQMGPNDELIFVEGGSTDGTWAAIRRANEIHQHKRKIVAVQQDGKGKGDAVRKGFSLASNEILMILDADLTVPPEELPRFYEVITSGLGEFVNGTRLVYPLEEQAMRFFNLLGNKAFALAFSFVLGQRFKDALCGTKVLKRHNYQMIAEGRSYFGDFDPFGDFDLIFGAARLGLKIIEVPVHYKARVHGATNISRWRHGFILAVMFFFAARKIKFI